MKWKTKKAYVNLLVALLTIILCSSSFISLVHAPSGTNNITVEAGTQFHTQTTERYSIHNCDDSTGWLNLSAQTMTFYTDTENETEGTGCVKTIIEFGAGGTAAFRSNINLTRDISDKTTLSWWISSNDSISTFVFILYDSNGYNMYWYYPVIFQNDEFVEHQLPIADPYYEHASFNKSDINYIAFQCIGVGNIAIWTDYVSTLCDATFTTGVDFDFYRIEVNSSHLWLDKSYTTKKYTRYCIYMESPYISSFTIETWFATGNSTAQITINSPTSTNINLGFYSPNLISASATGVVSYSWDAATQILSMTTNTNTNPVITISATVNETSHNIIPENYDVVITDMEGCGNWVFSEESYYTFRARYWDGDGYADLDTMKIRFSDGVTTVTAVYNQPDDEWTLESGDNIVNLREGTITVSDPNLLQVTFLIYFENTVLDALDIDISMWCNDTDGETDAWEVKSEDYFNIYNLGGMALLTAANETYSEAGRLEGGDVFDLYALWIAGDDGDGEWAQATLTFRNLQHVKLLPEIRVISDDADSKNNTWFEYFIDYCVNDRWIEGAWSVRCVVADWSESGSDVFFKLNVTWYQYGTEIKNQILYTYTEGEAEAWRNSDTVSMRLWVDLWFNRMNASSFGAGRLNAYYFPMHDAAHPWLVWLTGSNWGIAENQTKESLCFTQLIDQEGNVVYAPQIDFVRIRFKVTSNETPSASTPGIFAWTHDVFDLSFSPLSLPFVGIQTPVFDETRVPLMEQGGFLGAIVAGIHRFAEWISAGLGVGVLSFWNQFVGFVDTIFAWLGYPNAFSMFISWLGSLWGWLGTSFTWLISALTSMFTLLGGFLGKLLNTISTVVTQWSSMFQTFFAFLDGTYTSGVHIWNDLGLATWVILLAIMYPVYLFAVWDEHGIDRVFGHIKMMIDVASFIINLFIRVIQLTLSVIARIIESIPVVE